MTSPGSVAKILVVECVEIRALLELMLEKQGYPVVQSDVEHAIALLEEGGGIEVLITNAPQYFLRFADVKMLYIAAVPDPELEPYCTEVLRKPFTYRALAESVRNLLPLPTTGKPARRESGSADSGSKAASDAA